MQKKSDSKNWRKKFVIVLVVLSLTAPAAASEGCEEYIKTSKALVQEYKQLVADQDALVFKLTKQRNELANDIGRESFVPWYVWLVLGASAATITIGIRR